MIHKIAKTALGSIEYRSMGAGIPVLIVHGGHSNCNEMLSLRTFDTSRYKLLVPSRPGYGKTPLATHKSPQQAADLLAQFIEHLQVKQVIVYGISAGGLTALCLAATHPDKVSRLILVSAVTRQWLNKNEAIYKTGRRLFNPGVQGFTWAMTRLFARLFSAVMARQFYKQFSSQPAHRLQREDIDRLAAALQLYGSGSGFVNDIDQTLDHAVLQTITCPTLIVHSRFDNSVPFEHALHAHRLIPNVKLVPLENEWGHMVWIGSDAHVLDQTILDFIEKA
jgi:pimeloyl-ACP methyl ester carboxylesterase